MGSYNWGYRGSFEGSFKGSIGLIRIRVWGSYKGRY